jgi:hypothetical protein
MTTGFVGMRGTGDWVTDQRPLNWRQMILYLFPNGMAPLTAIMSKLGNEKVDDPQFNWWTQNLSLQAGAVAGIFTDINLSTAYVSGGVAGDLLYVQIAADLLTEFRVGHQVILKDVSDPTVDVNAKVVSRLVNGASSYVQVKLLEDDDNSTSHNLSDADYIMINGNINSEGAAMPDAISYDPTKWYNYTQIFRSPLEITRTAMRTTLRTGDAYQKLKRDALEYHSIEMEKAFLFGVPTETTGDNGKPERTTLGIIPAIKGGYTGHGGAAGTVSDYTTDTAYAGQTWLQGGEDWLDSQLEVMFRYGKREKLAFCGSGALMALNKIVKNGGDFSFNATTTSYGIKIVNWVTPLGSINLMTHPLFSQEPTLRNHMVIFEPENTKFRFIDDTTFFDDKMQKNNGWTRRDGVKEEYLTEAGLEYHHPIGWGYLTNLGEDNTL